MDGMWRSPQLASQVSRFKPTGLLCMGMDKILVYSVKVVMRDELLGCILDAADWFRNSHLKLSHLQGSRCSSRTCLGSIQLAHTGYVLEELTYWAYRVVADFQGRQIGLDLQRKAVKYLYYTSFWTGVLWQEMGHLVHVLFTCHNHLHLLCITL